MKNFNILESTRLIQSNIRDAYIEFLKITLRLVVVVNNSIHDGKCAVGYCFNAKELYRQRGLDLTLYPPEIASIVKHRRLLICSTGTAIQSLF